MGLTVKFYDVEHGNCTHIITPNNTHILFDIGSKNEKSICQHIKKTYFSETNLKLDLLVISHPHLDHIWDLTNMYYYDIDPDYLWLDTRAFPILFSESDNLSQIKTIECANKMYENFLANIHGTNNPENAMHNGGVSFSLFIPDVNQLESKELNNFSCVYVVEYYNFKIVLTGDNPANKLQEMLKDPQFKIAITDATVLLAPHHGRDNEFCSEFVANVNPEVTVFSDKHIVHDTQAHAAQKYGNITRGVNWDGQRRDVFTTRKDGTITFTFGEQGNWAIDTNKYKY